MLMAVNKYRLYDTKIIKLNSLANIKLHEINKDDIYFFNEYNTVISNKKKFYKFTATAHTEDLLMATSNFSAMLQS